MKKYILSLMMGLCVSVSSFAQSHSDRISVGVDLVSAGVLKTVDEHVTKDGKTYFYNGHKSLECNMINVLRAKPELFQNDVVRGNDFWHVYNSIPKSKNEDIAGL